MEIDEETVRALATEVDPENPGGLADLFIRMLADEHAARHQSKPRLARKFTQKIDDEQGGL
jgi:hypothetical protein